MLDTMPPWEPYRFWSKVRKTETCWLWTRGTYRTGYGLFAVMHWPRRAHHVAWELADRGTVPPGHNLHHLCGNRLCVNPDHLQLIGHGEHSVLHTTRDGTHCFRGHKFTPENTGTQAGGWRYCRQCRADKQRQRRAAARMARP